MTTATRMRRSAIAVASAGLVAAFPGCAARQNLDLEHARASYDVERRSPEVTTYARAELEEAGNTLREAEAALERKEEASEVSHLSEMTERQLDIARTRAKERAASSRTETLEQERDHLEGLLAALHAHETERGLVVTLGDVLFETNRAELKAGATGTLLQLAALVQANPDRAVLIEGHADARGDARYNIGLSQRRAESVERFFLTRGVDGDRMVASGYGEDYPVASNATRAGQTMNRRVEVVLLDPGVAPDVSHLTVW